MRTPRAWFAYVPPPDELAPNVLFVSRRRELALVTGTAGLLLLGFVVGFILGRRSGQRSSP